jgi:Protein of unknown function DUF262
MPLSFETKTLTVGELFSGSNIFRMPIYQRPFSWDEDTALQLFADIDKAMAKPDHHASGEYFLGPIIVAKNGSSSSPLDVVDGQQRLVTLSAIFAILRDLLSQGPLPEDIQECLRRPEKALRGIPEQPRVRLREVDHDEYEKWIQGSEARSIFPRKARQTQPTGC